MIPELVDIPGAPFKVLPPGIHEATFAEVQNCFAYNRHRRCLFDGLISAAKSLKSAGCRRIYLDGSYVSSKPHPSDYDGCWHPADVRLNELDPVLLDFENGRQKQKLKYKGEFFPYVQVNEPNGTFVDFFQVEKITGDRKGILLIAIGEKNYLRGVSSNDL